jgi:DNA-binding NtrC family response regulator
MNGTNPVEMDGVPGKTERIQRILLVDDNGPLCNLVWCQLTAVGYHVLTASKRAEAEEIILNDGPESIDLLIADQNMPFARGYDLAEWFQRQNPAGKALLMSVHANTEEPRRNIGFIRKPFRLETLGGLVREFLAADPGPAEQKAA